MSLSISFQSLSEGIPQAYGWFSLDRLCLKSLYLAGMMPSPGCTGAPRYPLLEATALEAELQTTNPAGMILLQGGAAELAMMAVA